MVEVADYDFMFFLHNEMRIAERRNRRNSSDEPQDMPVQQKKRKRANELETLGPVTQDHPTELRTRSQVAHWDWRKKQKEERKRQKEEQIQKKKYAQILKAREIEEAARQYPMRQKLSHIELSKLRTKLWGLTSFDPSKLEHADVEWLDPFDPQPTGDLSSFAKLNNPSPELLISLKEQYTMNKVFRSFLNMIVPGPAKTIQYITQRLRHRNKVLLQNLEFGFKDDDFKLGGWGGLDYRSYGLRSNSALAKRKKDEMEKRQKMAIDGETSTCATSQEAESSMRGQMQFNKTIMAVLNVPNPEPNWELRHAITLFDDRNRLIKQQLESVGETPKQDGFIPLSTREDIHFDEHFDFEEW